MRVSCCYFESCKRRDHEYKLFCDMTVLIIYEISELLFATSIQTMKARVWNCCKQLKSRCSLPFFLAVEISVTTRNQLHEFHEQQKNKGQRDPKSITNQGRLLKVLFIWLKNIYSYLWVRIKDFLRWVKASPQKT